MPCSLSDPGSPSDKAEWELSTLFGPLFVPFCTGRQWFSLDVTVSEILKNLNRDNHLQHSMDVLGTPWKVEVERAGGIEPPSKVWETFALPLSYARPILEGWAPPKR